MRELTWHERQFLALVMAGIPAFVIGLFLGLWRVGGRELAYGTVLMRGVYCSVFPVILACLIPRFWILPAFTYLIGFRVSFGIADGFAGLAELILTVVRGMEGKGEHIVMPSPSHPDLLWISGIALWLAGLASLLRQSKRFAAMFRRLKMQPEERGEG